MSPRRLVVVSGGLGQPSATRLLGDRLSEATRRRLAEREVDVSVEVIELRGFARELADSLVTGFPSRTLAEAVRQVTEADALIAVSPIFSASYSGLFKMFFDTLQPESLAGKPTLLAATAGTARHSLALEHAMRPLFAYLRTVTVPTAVFAATEDWASPGELTARVERAAGELADLLSRAGSAAPVRADEPTFADLLGRVGQ